MGRGEGREGRGRGGHDYLTVGDSVCLACVYGCTLTKITGKGLLCMGGRVEKKKGVGVGFADIYFMLIVA